jgi:hypothetical protein
MPTLEAIEDRPSPLRHAIPKWFRPNGILILTVLAVTPLLAYVLTFAPGSHWRFSLDPEDWAHFGEYAAGMYGALAFMGVLITLGLQRKQLRQLSDQATTDELHRLCREISATIDAVLYKPLYQDSPMTGVQGRTFGSKTMAGVLERALTSEDMTRQALQVQRAEIQVPSLIVTRELAFLQDILSQLFVRNGKSVIFDYYHDRYRNVVEGMQLLEFVLESSGFWRAGENK